jgi:hypothetical protein
MTEKLSEKHIRYAAESEELTSRVTDFITGVLKGTTTDFVGAPVDIINTVLSAVGLGSKKPIGGSANLREVLGQSAEDRSGYETAGTLLNPENALKSMIVGAARIPARLAKYDAEVEKAAKSGEKLTRAETFDRTGVYTDKDQIPKTIISDSEAYLLSPGERGDLVLEDVLGHKELFSLYPELKKIPFKYEGSPNQGGMRPDNSRMTVGKASYETELGVILHETQHAIQNIEKFTRGDNPRNYLPTNIDQTMAKLKVDSTSSDPTIAASAKEYTAKMQDKIREANTRYLNAGGEQEARFTQANADKDIYLLGSETARILKSGDTPQNYDTRLLRPVETSKAK